MSGASFSATGRARAEDVLRPSRGAWLPVGAGLAARERGGDPAIAEEMAVRRLHARKGFRDVCRSIGRNAADLSGGPFLGRARREAAA